MTYLAYPVGQVIAQYCTRKDWGYRILLIEKYAGGPSGTFWEDIDGCYVGPMTASARGITDLSRKSLGRAARAHARELLAESECTDCKIEYVGYLLPRNPWGALASLRTRT